MIMAEEGDHLISSTNRLTLNPVRNSQRRQFCSNWYKIPVIEEKAAILLIVWNALVQANSEFLLMSIFNVEHIIAVSLLISVVMFSVNLYTLSLILYPLLSWLADVKTGRFAMLVVAQVSYGISHILIFGVFIIVIFIQDISSAYIIVLVMLCLSMAMHEVGSACFDSNIVQFVMDHMVGSSAEQLSFAIYWIVWGKQAFVSLCDIIFCTWSDEQFLITAWILSILSCIAGCVLLYYSKRHLMTCPQITNPIKHVIRVLSYARKNKYPRMRSALTYWEEDYPSRIDQGKDKYGGPFTEEEVEDVKTVLRLIPVIICAGVFAFGSWMVFSGQHLHVRSHQELDQYCEVMYSLLFFTPIVLLPVYHFFIYPIFHKYIPSILRRIGIGLSLLLLSFISSSTLDLFQHLYDQNAACYFSANSTLLPGYDWYLIPYSLYYLSYSICFFSLFEFVIAQSPCHMRGLTVALLYTVKNIYSSIDWGTFIFISLFFPVHSFPGCRFYYHMAYLLIVCVGLVLFVTVARRYKLRVRNVPVPYHMFAENYYDKYIGIRQKVLDGLFLQE